MANHEKNFKNPSQRESTLLYKIKQDARVGRWEDRKKHLRELYGLSARSHEVLEVMATLEAPDWTVTYDGCTHHLLEGHTWLQKQSSVDFDSLLSRGLIEQPRIDGEVRDRIYHRQFWNLTTEARDLLDATKVGTGIGDLNESVTHSIGVALTALYSLHVASQNANTEYEIDVYAPDEGVVYDLLTRDADTGMVLSASEVETSVTDYSRLWSEAEKLAYQPGPSIWVAPTRDVLVRILNTLREIGFVSLPNPLPRTLSLVSTESVRGIRQRIYEAGNDLDPSKEYVTDVATYAFLAEELKQVRPEFFYTNLE